MKRAAALVLGMGTCATGLVAVFKGRSIDPFLSRDSAAVLERFGSGRDLLEGIDLPLATRQEHAERIVKVKEKFDAGASFFSRGDFSVPLRRACEEDFKEDRVVVVNDWILSEAEVGIYIYNDMKRRRLIKG